MSSSSSASPTPERSPPLRKRKRIVPIDSDSEDSSDSDGDNVSGSPKVPALSHAERRRQRKKEKLQAKETEELESPAKKQKLKDDSSTVPGKRQNSVWVGNMSFKTTPESLKAFFEGVGEITRVNMPTKAPAGPGLKGENRGFAYVDFATPEAKAAAIARSEQPLTGRRLLIKDGDDFTGRPALPGVDGTTADASAPSKTHSKTAQKILRSQTQPPAPTLFLGNLGFETTEKSIRELLEAHRVVKKNKDESQVDADAKDAPKDAWIRKIRMGTFEDSGLCKGFAFVDFTTIEHATTALINPKNHHLDGRKLVVEYASADAVRRGGAPAPKREEGSAPKRRVATSRSPRGERKERQRIKELLNRKTGAGDAPKGQVDGAEPADDTRASKRQITEKGRRAYSSGTSKGGKEKGPRVRPKPGAALALAKRESTAIIPSQGQKITF